MKSIPVALSLRRRLHETRSESSLRFEKTNSLHGVSLRQQWNSPEVKHTKALHCSSQNLLFRLTLLKPLHCKTHFALFTWFFHTRSEFSLLSFWPKWVSLREYHVNDIGLSNRDRSDEISLRAKWNAHVNAA